MPWPSPTSLAPRRRASPQQAAAQPWAPPRVRAPSGTGRSPRRDEPPPRADARAAPARGGPRPRRARTVLPEAGPPAMAWRLPARRPPAPPRRPRVGPARCQLPYATPVATGTRPATTSLGGCGSANGCDGTDARSLTVGTASARADSAACSDGPRPTHTAIVTTAAVAVTGTSHRQPAHQSSVTRRAPAPSAASGALRQTPRPSPGTAHSRRRARPRARSRRRRGHAPRRAPAPRRRDRARRVAAGGGPHHAPHESIVWFAHGVLFPLNDGRAVAWRRRLHPQRLGQRRVPGPRATSLQLSTSVTRMPRRPSDVSIRPRNASAPCRASGRRRLVLTGEPARLGQGQSVYVSSTRAAAATRASSPASASDTHVAAVRMRSTSSGSTSRRCHGARGRADALGSSSETRRRAARIPSTCRWASTLRSHVPRRLRPW